MIIGVPKEIKNNENRVALTPAGVGELIKFGNELLIQTSAREGSGFPDEEYMAAGAKIISKIKDVYAHSEMIIKVKEPIEAEYDLLLMKQLNWKIIHYHY